MYYTTNKNIFYRQQYVYAMCRRAVYAVYAVYALYRPNPTAHGLAVLTFVPERQTLLHYIHHQYLHHHHHHN